MADLTMPREAKQLINLTHSPIALIVPSEDNEYEPRTIVLQPEDPKEWLRKKRPEIYTMFIINDDALKIADNLHRTRADLVIPLLADGNQVYEEEGNEIPIRTCCDLLTLSGHPVKLVA